MNNISLGFSGDGFTMAENPIRDTLFAGNPELYYNIGNASTMISAMALLMGGILKGATGATKFKTIAVDGGRILIGNVAEDKVYDVIYQSTDSRILAMLGSNVVEGVLSGNPVNSSVSEIGDVARKVDIETLLDNKANFTGKLRGETITLNDIKSKEILYVKRETVELNKLRNYFNTTGRKSFLQDLSKKVNYLKDAGSTEKDILKMQNGRVQTDGKSTINYH